MNLDPSADTSPVSENLEAPVAPEAEGAATDANPAQSSSADNEDAKQAEPTELLDVVKRVVEKKAEEAEPSSSPEAEAGEAEAKPEGEADDPDADVPFHKHPRWQEMKSERDAYKVEAEQFRQITDFMQQSRLSSEEVAEGFAVMAALKSGSPTELQEAYDWFVQNTQRLAESLGHNLPADLQAKVDDGLLDVDVAKEYARERARANLLESQDQQRQQQTEQEQQLQQVRQQQVQIATAVQDWEAGIKAKDPDYATKKAVLVEDQVRAIIQRNGGTPPRSTEEALALVQQAYGEVNDRIRAFIPKPRAVTPPPAGLSAPATTAPQTLRDAVRAALNR